MEFISSFKIATRKMTEHSGKCCGDFHVKLALIIKRIWWMRPVDALKKLDQYSDSHQKRK